MTGFGRASLSVDGVTIEVSIKSVNGRYLEIRPHLPKKYYSFENEIVKALKGDFQRGTCDVYIQRATNEDVEDVEFKFKTATAKRWLNQFRKTLKELKIADNLTAQDLLQIPDFIQAQEHLQPPAKEKAALLKVVKQSIEKCLDEREREGEFLRKTCVEHVNSLATTVKELKELRQSYVETAQARIEERLKKLLAESKTDENRIVQEVAHLVDRTDIEEEIHRLQEHVSHVLKLLGQRDTGGKKLDFYAQELIREINTIGSKSQSAKITETVVRAKNTIEQLREQIQNIE